MDEQLEASNVRVEEVPEQELAAKEKAKKQFEVKRKEMFSSMSMLFEDKDEALKIIKSELSHIYDQKTLDDLYKLFVMTYNQRNANEEIKDKKLKLTTLKNEIDSYLDDKKNIIRYSNAGSGFF